jgi:glycosyltransferase involved in cell wall biosynthesis
MYDRLDDDSERPPTSLGSMRIALFTDTFPPTVNGVSRTLRNLVDHALYRGHDVGLVSTRVSDSPAEGPAFHHQLPGVPMPMYPELQVARWLDRRGRDLLTSFKPDLVHIATEATAGWSGRAWARRNRVPLVSSFHTDFPAYLKGYGFGGLEGFVWWGLRTFHAPARITFCPSSATKEQLRAHGFGNDIRIWSRGVDTNGFSPAFRREDVRQTIAPGAEKILVYTGRLAPEKRLDILMEAFPMVRETLGPKVALVLVGDGPWMGRLREARVEGVHFLGYRTGVPLAEAYAAGDVFAFPSDTETFGNVVTEALASGLPVVAPAKGGVVDSVISGKTGILVPPRDPKAFADGLLRLLTDEGLRQKLAAGARAFTEDRNWAVILDQLFADYEEALSPPVLKAG